MVQSNLHIRICFLYVHKICNHKMKVMAVDFTCPGSMSNPHMRKDIKKRVVRLLSILKLFLRIPGSTNSCIRLTVIGKE